MLVFCGVTIMTLQRKFVIVKKQVQNKSEIKDAFYYKYTQNAKKIVVRQTDSVKKFVNNLEKRDNFISTPFAFVTAISKNHFYEFSAHFQSVIDFTRFQKIDAIFFIYSLDSDPKFISKLDKYLLNFSGLNYWF